MPTEVTVVIPCFNEARHITACLDSLVHGDYPLDRLEILVVDGLSTDGTRDIVKRYGEANPIVRLLDNPQRIKPVALNIGIAEASGTFVVRIDAHAIYDASYLSLCVANMAQPGVENVGGVRRTLPGDDTLIAQAIANAISNPFTAGNATYRTGSTEARFVDTVFGGCYRKTLFAEIGNFDERLIRGQDREFNYRLTSSGGKILLVPDIKCDYIARPRYLEYVRWNYAGGLTPFYISRVCKEKLYGVRNLVPMLFVLGVILGPLAVLLLPQLGVVYLGVLATYLLLALFAAFRAAAQDNNMALVPVLVLVFVSTHISYGVGSMAGIFKPIRSGEWTSV